jgi:dihydropteroate synthase
MGVLNVTPDSFSDGGRFFDFENAVAHGREMVQHGADFIDVGGESTRPGSDPVSENEEKRRVVPVIKRLVEETTVPISIDTYKAAVADAALSAGATIVNDISGLTFDPDMLNVAVRHRASVVIMHVKGTPKTMQENPVYADVVGEISEFLRLQAKKAEEAGVEQIVIDPGIGFGKRLEHNLELIRRLAEFKSLGYPLLVGPSRKSFIGKLLDLPVDQRLEGTAAAVSACILNGANIVRVHDVKEMKRVASVADAVKPSWGKNKW